MAGPAACTGSVTPNCPLLAPTISAKGLKEKNTEHERNVNRCLLEVRVSERLLNLPYELVNDGRRLRIPFFVVHFPHFDNAPS